MAFGWRHPIHALPFDEPVVSALAEEFAEQPFGRRAQALRKAAFREAMLLASGQAARRVERVPASTRSMLWVYTWTTVGDAIMDLGPRVLVPASIAIDLFIAAPLAPLFTADRRLRAVHTDASSLPGDIDFVLLDSWRTTSLRLKAKRFPRQPFASMRGHHAGERFDRAAFADRRIRQLFGLPPGDVVAPRLDLGATPGPPLDDSRFRIAVPLGARVSGKRYPHWNELLPMLVAQWPAGIAAPEFRFLGLGESARDDLASIAAAFVTAHGDVLLDSGDLRETAFDMAACDAFLGVDGGLMHVAVGVGTPGLALFTRIDPRYFLRPDSTMQALSSPGELSALAPARVVDAFLRALPGFVAERRGSGQG